MDKPIWLPIEDNTGLWTDFRGYSAKVYSRPNEKTWRYLITESNDGAVLEMAGGFKTEDEAFAEAEKTLLSIKETKCLTV